jgi:hypothetical protein
LYRSKNGSKASVGSIEKDNKDKGIEEIGEGSTYFEHNFEFWGTWKIKKPGITIGFLQNWPKK